MQDFKKHDLWTFIKNDLLSENYLLTMSYLFLQINSSYGFTYFFK